MRLDSAVVSAEGSFERNDFSIELLYKADNTRMDGWSSLKNGAWRAALKDFYATNFPDWRFCAPAELTYSASSGAEVSGLCLTSGKSRLSFSGIFKTYFPEVTQLPQLG